MEVAIHGKTLEDGRIKDDTTGPIEYFIKKKRATIKEIIAIEDPGAHQNIWRMDAGADGENQKNGRRSPVAPRRQKGRKIEDKGDERQYESRPVGEEETTGEKEDELKENDLYRKEQGTKKTKKNNFYSTELKIWRRR